MYNFIEVGRVLKPYRTEGFLVAEHKQSFSEELLSCDAIFLKINGLEVPFFVEDIEIEDDLAYIKFEEFSNPDDIKKFNGGSLYIRERDIKEETRKKSKIRIQDDFVDYIIIDKDTKKTMVIVSIVEYPHQIIANVIHPQNKDKTIKVPLVEELITSIDDAQKTIYMDLPEGLLEL